MVSLTATLFKALVHDTSIADATVEYIIDVAISNINLYSKADLSLMSGTSPNKTVNLESEEYAAVLKAARAVYYGFYKGVETATAGGAATVSNPDLESNPVVLREIKEAARQLAELDVGRA